MSWSDATLRSLLLVLVAGLLASCGYRPLYGETGAGVRASQALSQVYIEPIGAGLLGLDLRNQLLDRLNPAGEPISPTHTLSVVVSSGTEGVLVQPDSATTRYNYVLVAVYHLRDNMSRKVVASGNVRGLAAYNVVTSEYATVVARRSAEQRATQLISDELSLRLALAFHDRPQDETPKP